jgi:uncharacterized protein (DUF4415 family)
MKTNYDFTQGKRGQVTQSTGKTRVTIYLDNAVLEDFREAASKQGKGYQTLINEALRGLRYEEASPLTTETLRQILREEFKVHAVS